MMNCPRFALSLQYCILCTTPMCWAYYLLLLFFRVRLAGIFMQFHPQLQLMVHYWVTRGEQAYILVFLYCNIVLLYYQVLYCYTVVCMPSRAYFAAINCLTVRNDHNQDEKKNSRKRPPAKYILIEQCDHFNFREIPQGEGRVGSSYLVVTS